MTALETGPVSGWWIKHELHGQDAPLERLRVDRQLEEAHGPDPLHLADVFGLDEKTAIRYADSARPCWSRPPRSALWKLLENPKISRAPRVLHLI
ncbi:hypothetical protein [Streptomyces griseus]|uniref:hypothetical protein n=1 Tax=Streptomyces griseus TaxID=1911 RepID=UPI00068BE3F5|nr:hypothetical protein [Streptomyces griseus]